MAEIVPLRTARRLLLHGQRLGGDPDRAAGPGRLLTLVEQLGYVQVDSIQVSERAHHTIVRSRMHGATPSMLRQLVERDRSLFEHWTHDASLVPTRDFRFWKHRFARAAMRIRGNRWWQERMGPDPEGTLDRILDHVREHGPTRSRDLTTPGPGRAGAWWDWKPAKVALEHLWRTGRLLVTRRDGFEKVYDLAARVLPEAVAAPPPTGAEVVEWACAGAMSRLVVATAPEIRAFYRAVSLPEVRGWVARAVAAGRLVPVRIPRAAGGEVGALALADWRARARRIRPFPPGMRLLTPFDPAIRDRARLLDRFGFDYRFEAFVPAARRRYGYYVLPLLVGESLVGRVDLKRERDADTLRVRGLWWEPGVRAHEHAGPLRIALRRMADAVGCARVRPDPDVDTQGS